MKIQTIAIVIPIKIHGNTLRVWMQKRESTDELNGMFEFAGGKIERNETPQEAASREFREEVGLQLTESKLSLLSIYNHSYESKTVSIYALTCEYPIEGLSELGWHEIGSDWRERLKEKIPPANFRIFEDLVKQFLK